MQRTEVPHGVPEPRSHEDEDPEELLRLKPVELQLGAAAPRRASSREDGGPVKLPAGLACGCGPEEALYLPGGTSETPVSASTRARRCAGGVRVNQSQDPEEGLVGTGRDFRLQAFVTGTPPPRGEKAGIWWQRSTGETARGVKEILRQLARWAAREAEDSPSIHRGSVRTPQNTIQVRPAEIWVRSVRRRLHEETEEKELNRFDSLEAGRR
ncbi:hypothetical protein NDU88_004708 [Pleurodeles waltl]|uniref:Uncharacterized protein n=1 Tax=Pleurodeles waltl TaxID=8319 RepID=A0AAV7VHV0_PLEWA|nr:hypothetical protein NDU88_004708 [Pleurodeles waltl]